MFTIRFLVDGDRSRRSSASTRASGVLRKWTIAIAAVGVALGVLVAPAARGADKLPLADSQAIERTIRSQLDAFGQADADRAFAFASPDIQKMFGSSDAFMRMVRDHYEPVYRAGFVNFGKLEAVGGQWVQSVQIVDGEGRVWRALFTMRRQPDRSWKVGGCQLVQTSALAT